MAVTIVTSLNEDGQQQALKVSPDGALVTAAEVDSTVIALLDKLDTIITKLEAVEAAVQGGGS